MSDSPSPDPQPPEVPTVVDPFRSNRLLHFLGECFNVVFELPIHVTQGHLYQNGKVNVALLIKIIVQLVVSCLTVLSVMSVAYLFIKIITVIFSIPLFVSSLDIGGFLRRFIPIVCRLLPFFSSSSFVETFCAEPFTELVIDEADKFF